MGPAQSARVGVRAARAACHPGAVHFKAHHHDAVYVSEYRSASAGGRRRPRNSTAPTHAPKTRGPGNAGGVRLGRNTLSRPTRSKQRLGLTGGVHTCPRFYFLSLIRRHRALARELRGRRRGRLGALAFQRAGMRQAAQTGRSCRTVAETSGRQFLRVLAFPISCVSSHFRHCAHRPCRNRR